MEKPLWTPTPQQVGATNVASFVQHLSSRGITQVSDFTSLHRFSVAQPDAFWQAVWTEGPVVGSRGEHAFVQPGDDLRTAQFFPGAELNYAENILAHITDGDALVFRGEDKVQRRMTGSEVTVEVARLGALLDELGLQVGDRVAAMLPNMPEGIIGALAASSRGVIWSSCSPDFGRAGVLDRFGQIEPKVLIVSDGYFYNGKTIDIADKLIEITDQLPSLERVLVVNYTGMSEDYCAKIDAHRASAGRKAMAGTWQADVSGRAETTPKFVRLSFDAPLYILFSSGTTGIPKCIVHSNGGVLFKHLTEHKFHTDVRRGDRVFYFTTLGWMMWNWLVSGLGCGATLMLYDGSPFYPDSRSLWAYAADERFTHFGTSAKYIDALKKSGTEPKAEFDLPDLRAIMSTGSPLVAEAFDYVYSGIKTDVHLASISGGTDIVGCFVLGDPTSPVWRGEIQAPALGLHPDVAAPDGAPVALGKGELVCRNAFPSMPVGFWNDPDGRRYQAAYFDRMPGLWHHGDFAEWTENGGMIIHGRSDATLNPGGVRIGTAEIYRQVEQLPEITESIVIGQDWENDVRVVLFVVLAKGAALDEHLERKIRQQIRNGASPRHVPAKIVAVEDIPRTKSGKITELAVRDIVHGREVSNTEALANPEALAFYRSRQELMT
ncbi:MAG: acetoacetate--CoA ligase [Pseudomonadota bacterium]